MKRCDAIVIGAGAAGMMCAATAAQRGASVLLVDHYHKLGEKIRISGGGRCNFTNIHTSPSNYLSQNPHFCRSALARYTPRDFINLVESHGISYHEKTLGQLFCDESATDIIRMLHAECTQIAHSKGGRAAEWRMPASVSSIERAAEAYVVRIGEETLATTSLVIATGGLSVPKIGATPFGYRIAEQFGLPIIAPRPALVPLSFDPADLAKFGDLSGLSLDAETQCHGGSFREAILLTHRGLSGPAILQISSYWQMGECKHAIQLDLLPHGEAELDAMRQSKSHFANALASVGQAALPKRFADAWCTAHGWQGPCNQMSDRNWRDAIGQLRSWRIKPSGTLGYNKAEVTLGGVDTRALSSKSMEATSCPGLFFIGEVVDVTGHLGGFNFQWAWASGHAAGLAVAERSQR